MFKCIKFCVKNNFPAFYLVGMATRYNRQSGKNYVDRTLIMNFRVDYWDMLVFVPTKR